MTLFHWLKYLHCVVYGKRIIDRVASSRHGSKSHASDTANGSRGVMRFESRWTEFVSTASSGRSKHATSELKRGVALPSGDMSARAPASRRVSTWYMMSTL